MITRMVLGHKLPVSTANDIDTGSEQNYWLESQPTNRTSPRIEPETLFRRTSLDIPTVMELEDEVTSVQDEEVPADLDSQQEPKDLVDGEFDLAYLELASSTARLSWMHMEAATLCSTLWMVNTPRVSVSVIIRRKA